MACFECGDESVRYDDYEGWVLGCGFYEPETVRIKYCPFCGHRPTEAETEAAACCEVIEGLAKRCAIFVHRAERERRIAALPPAERAMWEERDKIYAACEMEMVRMLCRTTWGEP